MPKRRSMKSQQNVPQKHPPKKIAYKIRGQIREYYFLKTVNSVDELDKIRFKVMQKMT
jgi:hypothetical protein